LLIALSPAVIDPIAKYWLRFVICAYPPAIMFGMEKLEWCGYQTGVKILKIHLFVLTEFTKVMDGHRMAA